MTTLYDEMIAAFAGLRALVLGRRDAADHFDFTRRGLVGSFMAFLLTAGASALLARVLAGPEADGSALEGLVLVLLIYGIQIGSGALLLMLIGRLDGLVPYLVADNWTSFFMSLLSMGIALIGIGGDFAIILLGLLVILVEINIARLIVTLKPGQIVLFLLSQFVGVMVGLLLIGAAVMPGGMPPL